MKPEYLYYGFWKISEDFARELSRLPKPGYEISAMYDDIPIWISRTPHKGKAIWSMHAQNDEGEVRLYKKLCPDNPNPFPRVWKGNTYP